MRYPLALGLSLLCLSACDLLQPKVSREKLESALKDWLVTHDLEATDIHCPDNQKLEKGNTFECTCKVHGTDIPVRVEVTDPASGTVEWKPKYMTMKGEEFAKEIRANDAFKDHKIEVTCTDKVLVSIPDSEWDCEFVDRNDGDKQYAAKVTFTNGDGGHDLKWKPK